MTKNNKKTIINIVILILIFVITAYLIYSHLATDNYKYKLTQNKIEFYSDENIIGKIQMLKDSNYIVLVVDNTENENYNLGNAILFRQIFAYNYKTTKQYILSNNQCLYSDENKYTHTTTIDNCKNIFSTIQDNNTTIIYIGNIKKKDVPEIIITNNEFNIVATTIEDAYKENHDFLEFIYPNISEIEKKVSDAVSNVTKTYNSNTNLPTG